jgi:hypothetical protein
MILAVRRRRYCVLCGNVQAEDGETCLACGTEGSLTKKGEPWHRIRARPPKPSRSEKSPGTPKQRQNSGTDFEGAR